MVPQRLSWAQEGPSAKESAVACPASKKWKGAANAQHITSRHQSLVVEFPRIDASNPAAERCVVIPDTFSSASQYQECLSRALVEDLNLR